MHRPVFTKQFKKDNRLTAKQGRDIDQFKLIARSLISGKKLDPIFKDHQLVGIYIGRRECHVESDWLPIYRNENDIVLIYDLTGREVAMLYEGELLQGTHSLNWNGIDDKRQPLSSGLYWCRLQSGGTHETVGVVLLR